MTGRPRAALAAASLALAALTAATACGGDARPELAASGAFIPAPVSGESASGFLTVENTGDADDTLTGVTSPAATSVEMYETKNNAMRQVDSFAIPADGALRLTRGGDHLMLLGLDHLPREGDTVTLTLRFATSDPITLDVPVRPTTYTGDEGE